MFQQIREWEGSLLTAGLPYTRKPRAPEGETRVSTGKPLAPEGETIVFSQGYLSVQIWQDLVLVLPDIYI